MKFPNLIIRVAYFVLFSALSTLSGCSSTHNAKGDPDLHDAEATAMNGEKILHVGSNSEIRKLMSKTSRLIEAKGKMVVLVQDLMTIAPESIRNVKVLSTILAGK